jgi:flagellar biosynthesis/type III secretory pathway chaperone
MLESIKNLVEALRDELKNYGEMLALLDRQQEHLLHRAGANEVAQSVSLIQAQGSVIQKARDAREEWRRAVAEEAGEPVTTTFKELIPLLPADYQPLLQALVDENNELLYRVRRRARQNHLMLKRSVELMQQLLNSLCPPQQPVVVNGHEPFPAFSWAPQELHEEVN